MYCKLDKQLDIVRNKSLVCCFSEIDPFSKKSEILWKRFCTSKEQNNVDE